MLGLSILKTLRERSFDTDLKARSSVVPNDPVLLSVQQWLYDSTELQSSIATFIGSNHKKYQRDDDAELWPTSMTVLHRDFNRLLEQSLGKLLQDEGYTAKQFEKAIRRAIRHDITSDDATVVKLLVSATQFRSFEILLRDAHYKYVNEIKEKKRAKMAEYQASGGKEIKSKHAVDVYE